MNPYQMGPIESRVADIIWTHEPLSSSQLAAYSLAELGWKKTTSYTVLRRLCDKGLFQNENGTVTSRVSKQDYAAMQSERFVDEAFSGSLPAFLAAFTTRRRLTADEAAQLRALVEQYEEDS